MLEDQTIKIERGCGLAKIGLLSDSHGQAEITRWAVEALLREGIQVLLHLGDVCGVEVIDALAVENVPAHVVFGNMDFEKEMLTRYAHRLGVAVDDPVGKLSFDGRDLVYTHGHIPSAMPRALEQGVAFFCHGHTHEMRNELYGPTRMINPGALFRAAKYTVAVLDTETDSVNFIQIDDAK